jgi:hypothetical protein
MVQDYVDSIAEKAMRNRRHEDSAESRASWISNRGFYKFWIKVFRKDEVGQLRYFLNAFNIDLTHIFLQCP